MIAAANPEEEALAIAVALREVLETDGKTAALVTPDRALARRVLAALERWNVAVDDSGGDALADTPAGVFARLVAEAALDGLAPVTLLALLKHPLMRLGAGAGAHRAIATLEQAVLRGPRPKPGTAGLVHALETFRDNVAEAAPRRSAHAVDARAIAGRRRSGRCARRRAQAARSARRGRSSRWRRFADAHRQVIDALSRGAQWRRRRVRRPRRRRARPAFEEIADNAPRRRRRRGVGLSRPVPHHRRRESRCAGPTGRACACASTACSKRACSRSTASCSAAWSKASGRRRRAAIPGSAGRCAAALGLDLPERRISLNAHDFAQMLGASEVVLAYPAKLAGAPTVASRFIQRLAAVAGEPRWDTARARGERYLAWARALDRPAASRSRSSGPSRSPRAPRARPRCPSPRSSLAARPLFDLRPPRPAPAAARAGRHAAGRARPRHRHP